jgi:hypothetical protein
VRELQLFNDQVQDNDYDYGMFVILPAASWLKDDPRPSRGMIHAARIAWMHSFAKNIADCEQTGATQA